MARDGEIITPPLDLPILPGITRARILELAANAGIPVRENTFTSAELLASDEVFLTNSLRGVVAVRNIDEKNFHNNLHEELTSVVQSLYNKSESEDIGEKGL